MVSDESQLFYGVLVSMVELCIAANAYSQLKFQLDFFKHLRLRSKNSTLSSENKVGQFNISKLPEDVLKMVEEEIIQGELEGAQTEISKEAVTRLRGEFNYLEFFNGTGLEWSDEMLKEDYDWETFVAENGGVLGPFKRTVGAIRIFQDQVDVSPSHLLFYFHQLTHDLAIDYSPIPRFVWDHSPK